MLTSTQHTAVLSEVLAHLRLDWFWLAHLPEILQQHHGPYFSASELRDDVIGVVRDVVVNHGLVIGSLTSTGIVPWPEPLPDAALRRLSAALVFSSSTDGYVDSSEAIDAWLAFPTRLLDWRLAP